MATIKDVAAETGLTVSTVSRVLNNRGYISDKTRKKVYDAMNKLNYTQNEVARSLSKKTNNTIGVIVPHIRHPYFSELISNLEMAAYEKNYKIFIFNSREKQEKENEYLEMCYSNRVAGVIMCSGSVHLNVFDGLNIPIVTIERFLENGTAGVECDGIWHTVHVKSMSFAVPCKMISVKFSRIIITIRRRDKPVVFAVFIL